MVRRRWRALVLVAGGGIIALAGAIGAGQATTGEGVQASPLRKACGSKVVVVTDWYPQPEHGYLYQLAGTKGTLNTKNGRYTGTIKGTGVQFEIRSGGPYISYEPSIAQLYKDRSITLAYASSDELVQNSKTLPAISIVAPDEFSPLILMWNPQKFPNVRRFADIKGTGAPVLVFPGGTYVDYLVGKGWISDKQVDASYDGSPARFVSQDGALFQQGFVTSEPYLYEHEISAYKKKVAYLLIRNSGWVPYPQTLAARPRDVKAKAACFRLLVPLIQRAQVDYAKNPRPINAKLVQIVGALNTFWRLSPGGNAYNTATQKKLKIVSNGPDCTLGNMSLKRLEGLINIARPIFEAKRLNTFNPNVKATDIATNRFINPSIGLPKKGCPKR